MGNSRITVREIARLAGVSVATVSRVSNGTGQVSPELRQRVLDAIELHGYQPDHLGRALAARRHGALGLVFPGLSGPYFSELIQGFESEAVPARASVHILCTHLREDSDAQVLEMARRVDGIAVMGGTISESALRTLADLVPVVVLAGPGGDAVPSVGVDNADAMSRLTGHLLAEHGLRDLVFVGTPEGSPDVSQRWAGFLAAHRELGLTPPTEPIRVSMQQPDGVLAADQLLHDRQPRTPSSVRTTRSPSVPSSVLSVVACGCRRTWSSPDSTTRPWPRSSLLHSPPSASRCGSWRPRPPD
ncbi:hypothetical protein GCM10027614_03670 [Micromonospora vulcania]